MWSLISNMRILMEQCIFVEQRNIVKLNCKIQKECGWLAVGFHPVIDQWLVDIFWALYLRLELFV